MTIYDKYLTIILPAMAKFVRGPLAGIALQLSWWQTLICSISGMMVSVVVVTYLGKAIWAQWHQLSETPPNAFRNGVVGW